MDFNLNSILSGDSAIGKLANSYVSGLAQKSTNKPKPVVVQVSAPAPVSSGMDSKTMLWIGGGALALVAVLAIAMRK